MRTAGRLLAVLWFTAAAMGAQAPAPGDTGDGNTEVDPITCWWRPSVAAVRVGETFSVALTCAVIENDSTIVVPDQSRLEPSVVQMPPFELLDGMHHADLHTANRRFFQYEYRLRIVHDGVFGTDVDLPAMTITYRVQTRTDEGTLVEGLDRKYLLPAIPMRVLSLVPENAADIRDTSQGIFSEFEARTFRSNVLFLIASILLALSGAVALWTLVRLARMFFAPAPEQTRLISDSLVLRTVARELSSVQKERELEGWSEALTGRALTAFRILGTYALAQRTTHIEVTAARNGHEGQLLVRGAWPRRNHVLISGSVTPDSISQALGHTDDAQAGRADLEGLQTALARFGAVRYGREARIDATPLDESLAHGMTLARTLWLTHLPIAKKVSAIVRPLAARGYQAWNR